MKTDDQDMIRDIIEIPKEQVKTTDLSVYERERLLRDIDLKAVERNSEAQLFDLTKDRFKQRDAFERWEGNRRLGIGLARGITDLIAGIGKGFGALFSDKPNVAGSIGGFEQAAKGGISMIDVGIEYDNKQTDRRRRYEFGMREFSVKGERMQAQHETNRANDMERL